MNRRTFLCGLTLGTLSAPLAAQAQPAGRVARIGVLWFTFPPVSAPFFEALRDGLHELGYVEGQHIAFEQRWAEKDPRRYPGLAEELVRLKVDVIVAGNLESARAAKDATATIPIVLTAGGDPLRAGLLRGPDSQRCKAWRPPDRATHEVRAGHQPQDGEGAWPDDPAVAAAAGGRDHAVTRYQRLLPVSSGCRTSACSRRRAGGK